MFVYIFCEDEHFRVSRSDGKKRKELTKIANTIRLVCFECTKIDQSLREEYM